MYQATLTAGQTGEPQQAGIGAVARFVITSGSGYVQYTYGSFADIGNNVATWLTWPKGTVNATAQDTTGYSVIVRFVCVSGTVVAMLADASESEFPANVLIPWESMQPSYAYDSSRKVAGLLGPDGQVLPLASTVFKNNKTLLVGDSLLQFFYEQSPTVTAVTDNGTSVTIAFSGSHNFQVGSEVYVNLAPDASYNTNGSIVTAQVNSGTFSITYTKTDTGSPVVGANDAATLVYYPQRLSCLGGMAWLEFYLGDWLDFDIACAGGADSTQALTMTAEAMQTGQAYSDVIVCVGMNDIYARAWTYAEIVTSMTALLSQVRATGARVWVLLIPPRNSADTAWSAGKQVIHNQVNKWIYENARRYGAMPIDLWRATNNGTTWVNPAATNPDPTTGYTSASDYTHPLNIGASAMGLQLATAMQSYFGPYSKGFVGAHESITEQNNILLNPLLTGTGGTKTPGSGTINNNVPDSWTVEITAGTPTVTLTSPARTVSADGDASGNNLQAVFAYSGTGTQIFRLIQSSLHSLVTAGQTYRVKFPVTVTGATGMTGMELVLFGANATNGNANMGTLLGSSSALVGSYSGSLVVPEWTCPAGMTSLMAFARFYFTSGGATIVFGKPSFELVI